MKDKKTQLKKVNWNDLAILLILVVLVVILAFIRPVFLTPNNLLNIMRQVSICLLYTSDRCRRYAVCRSRWSPYH